MKARVAKPRLQGIDVANPVSSSPELQQVIAEAAYYRAERRGFAPGQEVEDWLAAEAEVMGRMGAAAPAS